MIFDLFFLPAVGTIHANGDLVGFGTRGFYWSSVQFSSSIGLALEIGSTGSWLERTDLTKLFGMTIRCVRSKSILFSCLSSAIVLVLMARLMVRELSGIIGLLRSLVPLMASPCSLIMAVASLTAAPPLRLAACLFVA